jgi:mono/diheme cytochrome c family protein
MSKRLSIAILALTVIFGSLALALAAEPDGNHRKGKYLFRKNCRACHIDGGSANVLQPLTYTMAEWESRFAPEAADGYTCKAEWPTDPAEVLDIFTYMYKFAKDSPTPAKCS